VAPDVQPASQRLLNGSGSEIFFDLDLRIPLSPNVFKEEDVAILKREDIILIVNWNFVVMFLSVNPSIHCK